jgi:arylsulfatase A-like enzyme
MPLSHCRTAGSRYRTTNRDFFYWEHQTFNRQTSKLRENAIVQAVRMGDWKAIRPKPGVPLALYDLSRDAGEANNVAAAQPAVVSRIEAYLKAARTTPRPHDTGSFEFKR